MEVCVGAAFVFLPVPGLGKATTQQMEFKENKISLTLGTKGQNEKSPSIEPKDAAEAQNLNLQGLDERAFSMRGPRTFYGEFW